MKKILEKSLHYSLIINLSTFFHDMEYIYTYFFQLPYSIVGSLNGVHMFGKPFKTEVLNTITDDYVVAWKEFEGR